jgi:hypothetical protein
MITQEYYYFLTNVVGCAYRGKVEGLGTVMTLPVTVANTSPASRAVNPQGIYLTTNYIPVIVPDPPQGGDPVREYEAERYIKERISRTNSDGSIDYVDVSTKKTHKLKPGGWVNVDIQGDQVFIHAKDSTDSFELISSLDLFGEQLEQAPTFLSFSTQTPEVFLPPPNQSFPAGKAAYDAAGITWNAVKWKTMEAKYRKGRSPILNGIKRQQKIKKIYEFKKFLKKHNIPVKTQTSRILDHTLPTFYKKAGKVILWSTVFLEFLDVYNNRAFKASHVLDLAMIGVTLIPYVGWVISLAYFLTDVSVMTYNYKKTGNAKGIGNYLDEWLDKKGWLEDGIIFDLSPILNPIFGPPANNQLPIIEPGKTISF